MRENLSLVLDCNLFGTGITESGAFINLKLNPLMREIVNLILPKRRCNSGLRNMAEKGNNSIEKYRHKLLMTAMNN
jgi:hypothetical protein